MTAQYRTIYLHGLAAERFRGPYRFECDTPREAIAALLRLKKGFKEFIEKGYWHIIRGPIGSGIESDLEMLNLRFGSVTELHIVPEIIGAGRGKSLGKALIGVALIGAAFAIATPAGGGALALGTTLGGTGITAANVLMTGIGLTLTGVSQMLAPNARVTGYGDREEANNRPSYLFNGPVNAAEQGHPIPIVYGKDVMCGSLVGAAGIFTEELPVT